MDSKKREEDGSERGVGGRAAEGRRGERRERGQPRSDERGEGEGKEMGRTNEVVRFLFRVVGFTRIPRGIVGWRDERDPVGVERVSHARAKGAEEKGRGRREEGRNSS